MEFVKEKLKAERTSLRKIAIFDPRFVEVYGIKGRTFLGLLSLVAFILSSYWMFRDFAVIDWNERLKMLIPVVLIAFGALWVGSVVGEVLIKGFEVIVCLLRNELKLPLETKMIGFLVLVLFVAAVCVYLFIHDGDIWVYPVTAAATICGYWFIANAWGKWYEKRSQQISRRDQN